MTIGIITKEGFVPMGEPTEDGFNLVRSGVRTVGYRSVADLLAKFGRPFISHGRGYVGKRRKKSWR